MSIRSASAAAPAARGPTTSRPPRPCSSCGTWPAGPISSSMSAPCRFSASMARSPKPSLPTAPPKAKSRPKPARSPGTTCSSSGPLYQQSHRRLHDHCQRPAPRLRRLRQRRPHERRHRRPSDWAATSASCAKSCMSNDNESRDQACSRCLSKRHLLAVLRDQV